MSDAELLWALCAQTLPPSEASAMAELVLSSGSYSALVNDERIGTLLRPRLSRAERVLDECRRLETSVVPLSSPSYPTLLRASPGPPLVLFVRSASAVAFPESAVAVVGSRSASVTTCATAAEFARTLNAAGLTIVSGLALGVDGAAHRGAIEGGRSPTTVAVLAHGLHTVYPASHERLAERIVANEGVIVSEYPPGTNPLKHHFLARNRIIAALSRGVLVIQAGAKSGSLVTARFAVDAGRDVFVFEGDAGDDRFEGSERLLADGAKPVTTTADILREYAIDLLESGEELITVPVVELLAGGVVPTATLARLELEGRIDRRPGGAVRISRSTLTELIASARASVARG